MEILNEFLKTCHVIHPQAEEVSIFNGSVEENLFDIKSAPRELIIELLYTIGSTFNEGVDRERLEQFSYQAADGISYFEPKLMLVYSGGKQAAKETNLPIEEAHEHYCINYFLHSKTKQTKFYDLHIDKHQKPGLPNGSTFAGPFGLGVSWNGLRKDVYFVHSNMKLVSEFFNLPMPSVKDLKNIDEDNTIEKVFGITYETNNLKPIKLKRYFYPKDPNLKTILFDEVKSE